ncbi:FMN-linked oxidoreductase [Byssothecium circinans]|uniref:FMN-linked oxidoreductase n=1 Tax=Byssothecium circinans TaxID=147558 RepID=A0A6A5TUN0_9PLEO|nr:FMN-linked oxidoreductase [Byssothecium circinans]
MSFIDLPNRNPRKENVQPNLFQPLKIRNLSLSNRIAVAPMGMYSSTDGHLTNFHLMHHGHFAFRGAGLTIVEVTAVTANGRTSTEDAGAYSDAHIPPLKRVVDYVHSIEGGNGKIAIQLGHSGRKGSMMPIYPGRTIRIAKEEDGGWENEVLGASPVPFQDHYATPREMTVKEIGEVVEAFGDAAERCVKAGFDAVEVHAAHGYLLSSFMSPISNHRTDDYGGSFENRIRFLLEVVQSIRGRIPATMPLFVRITATDWMEYSPETPQWTVEDSIKLAPTLSDHGVDVLDVSSGGNNAKQKIIPTPYYQVHLAEKIRKALKDAGKPILVAAVGNIDNSAMAEGVLKDGKADLVLVAREFMRNPNLVHTWADDLGAEMEWPRQYMRAPKNLKLPTY